MEFSRKLLFFTVGWMAIAGPVAHGQATAVQNPANPSAAASTTPSPAQSAQTGSPQAPSFEVASVRLVPMNKSGLTSIGNWGLPKFTVTNATLQLLVEMAFGVSENQIAAAPNWLESQEYDIDAKVEGDKGLTYEQMKPLIQQLLKDRFHLVIHQGMKDFQGYALVVGKNGPTLQARKGSSGHAQIVRGQLLCPICSPEVLAGMLARVTGRPIADKTGLKGNYDVKLDYAPEDDPNSSLPSIYTALQETLGLKLIPQKVPVEMLVIDHVDRVPTEN